MTTTTLARFETHHYGGGWLACGHPDCDVRLETDLVQVTEHRSDMGVTAAMLRTFADHMDSHGGHGAVQE